MRILRFKKIPSIIAIMTIIILTLLFTSFIHSDSSSFTDPTPKFEPQARQIRTYADDGARGFNDEPKKAYIKEMMKHAFNGYRKYAWGYDQLKPVSKVGDNWYGDVSMLSTPVDALDTLWIMGMKEEYYETKKLVLEKLSLDVHISLKVFETNIRILGGLLSAYELEGDVKLLEKAREVGDALSYTFNTSSGIPYPHMELPSKEPVHGQDHIILSEAGTLQLEMQYLSDVTGDPSYGQLALFALEQLKVINDNDAKRDHVYKGLYALSYDLQFLNSREFNRHGVGPMFDSFYEYLLKIWLSTSIDRYRDMFVESANAILNHIVQYTPDRKVAYAPDVTITVGQEIRAPRSFHHLACFLGGMYTLGSEALGIGEEVAKYADVGEKLTTGCWLAYEKSPTGLSGEFISVNENTVSPQDSGYMQRPETIESIFYMWRKTHNPKYREWGWEMAQSINKNTRTEGGFSALDSAFRKDSMTTADVQDSFFLAETLKYLYLLFCDDDVIPLEDYVFNTEAHPISRRGSGRRSDPSKWAKIPERDEEWIFGRRVGQTHAR